MKLGEILEFRKDLYFEGAVQADWFYDKKKASLVAENFVFHGSNYFGIDNESKDVRKRIDTISFVKHLTEKLNDSSSNPLTLAIADYGTGKSHLAVTLGNVFSGSSYMPDTYNKVIENISKIDNDSATSIKNSTQGKNFVIVLNGMKDFNLNYEILKATTKSLNLYGLSDEPLRRLNTSISTAEMFFERNANTNISLFEKAAANHNWHEKGNELKDKIREQLLQNEDAFNIIDEVYSYINGQNIRWDEGLSAASILELLINEFCGINGEFDHVILLFDEFGRYLEYASGTNSVKSGDSALQQIFEVSQNSEGVLQVINFIQSDIKTYLSRVDQTKNISRYIGRYDASDKYYLSSNLETVFANLINRKDPIAFNEFIVGWQNKNEELWKNDFNRINKWLNTKGIWKNYALFRKTIIEGIYPMHPMSTYILTQLSDYLQNRSSLSLMSKYINDLADLDVDSNPQMIMPETIMSGDLFTEMLVAEQEGRQASQQCIQFENITRKMNGKLSEDAEKVLRSNLILRILRFRTTSYEDAKDALCFCSGLTKEKLELELNVLENEYAVLGFDQLANCFDFLVDSSGAHDYKIMKKRMISKAEIPANYISDIRIKDILGIVNTNQSTNFGVVHSSTTNEWSFEQEIFDLSSFGMDDVNRYLKKWNDSIAITQPKGQLIWLYQDNNSNVGDFDKLQKLVNNFEGTPIVVMLLKDVDNRVHNLLVEFYTLSTMNQNDVSKYRRYFDEDMEAVKSNLNLEFEALKKERIRLTSEGEIALKKRLALSLSDVFETVYPNTIPFYIDGLLTRANNISSLGANAIMSIMRMLLSRDGFKMDNILNLPIEQRNRIETLFSNPRHSWRCIDNNGRIIPPEQKEVRNAYNYIVDTLKEKKEIEIKQIFKILTMPPYGINSTAIQILIAVVCNILNYCIRIRYNGNVLSVANWKNEIIIKDKRISDGFENNSTLLLIDSSQVADKYKRLIDRISGNRDINTFKTLKMELQALTREDEVPDELQDAYNYACKILSDAEKAYDTWMAKMADFRLEFDNAIQKSNFVSVLYLIDNLSDEKKELANIFKDYDYDQQYNEFDSFYSSVYKYVEQNIDEFIHDFNCESLTKKSEYLKNSSKYIKKLKHAGLIEEAKELDKKANDELANIDKIIERENLKNDIEVYLSRVNINNYINYQELTSYINEADSLNHKLIKYKDYLGKEAPKLQNMLLSRKNILVEKKKVMSNKLSSIFDDVYEIENITDINNVLIDINEVLTYGLSDKDKDDYLSLKTDLETVKSDLDNLNQIGDSLVEFNQYRKLLGTKYKDQEFDFEVLPIIENALNNKLDEIRKKEANWCEKYLTLGDKSLDAIRKWKISTQVLPRYLSDESIARKKELDKEADEIIDREKINSIILSFKELRNEDKIKCFNALKEIIE